MEMENCDKPAQRLRGNREAPRSKARLAGLIVRPVSLPTDPHPRPLTLLSIVTPARDEANCIASTVEHLHLELPLESMPPGLIVVQAGSSVAVWRLVSG